MVGEKSTESCDMQMAALAAPVPATLEVFLGQGPVSGPTQLFSYIPCSNLQSSGLCNFPILSPFKMPLVWAGPGAGLGKEPQSVEVLGKVWKLCSSQPMLSAKTILNSELLISWQRKYFLHEQKGGWMNAFLQENVTALRTGTSEPSLSTLAVGLCAGGVHSPSVSKGRISASCFQGIHCSMLPFLPVSASSWLGHQQLGASQRPAGSLPSVGSLCWEYEQ